jgi:hypothetical protein
MNRIYWWIILVILLVSFLPLAIVLIRYRGDYVFVSSKFIESYLVFGGNLISIAFGFFLVNVLWEKKHVNDKINQARRLLFSYVFKIQQITMEIQQLLSAKFEHSQSEKSEARDKEIDTLRKRIEKLAEGLENVTFEPDMLKDDSVRSVYIDNIWGGLLPIIAQISNITIFRNDYEKFNKLLIDILDLTQKSIKALG